MSFNSLFIPLYYFIITHVGKSQNVGSMFVSHHVYINSNDPLAISTLHRPVRR